MIQDLFVGVEVGTPLQMNQPLTAALQKCSEVIQKPSQRGGPLVPSCVKQGNVGRGVPCLALLEPVTKGKIRNMDHVFI